MSKKTKTNVKKVLVRNPSLPVRPNKVVQKATKSKKVHFEKSSPPPGPSQENALTTPEYCTLLQLADEMKKIRETHRSSSRSLPEGPRYRNLDFLPEEKVFKDLVDLDVPSEPLVSGSKSQPSLRTVIKKDPEPDPSQYLKYSLQPEYRFSTYCVPVFKDKKIVFDGRSIYRKVRMWEREEEE